MVKTIIFDKRETVFQSIATDVITCAVIALLIWFSWHMGGGPWTFITVCMLILYYSARFPWEGAKRKTILLSKADAIAWANSLPDDTTN